MKRDMKYWVRIGKKSEEVDAKRIYQRVIRNQWKQARGMICRDNGQSEIAIRVWYQRGGRCRQQSKSLGTLFAIDLSIGTNTIHKAYELR